jgi:hypothetical protein
VLNNKTKTKTKKHFASRQETGVGEQVPTVREAGLCEAEPAVRAHQTHAQHIRIFSQTCVGGLFFIYKIRNTNVA